MGGARGQPVAASGGARAGRGRRGVAGQLRAGRGQHRHRDPARGPAGPAPADRGGHRGRRDRRRAGRVRADLALSGQPDGHDRAGPAGRGASSPLSAFASRAAVGRPGPRPRRPDRLGGEQRRGRPEPAQLPPRGCGGWNGCRRPTGPSCWSTRTRSSDGEHSKVALLIGRNGIDGTYIKTRLVPFGEYIPFRRELGWLTKISQAAARNMVPGTGAHVLTVTTPERTAHDRRADLLRVRVPGHVPGRHRPRRPADRLPDLGLHLPGRLGVGRRSTPRSPRCAPPRPAARSCRPR